MRKITILKSRKILKTRERKPRKVFDQINGFEMIAKHIDDGNWLSVLNKIRTFYQTNPDG